MSKTSLMNITAEALIIELAAQRHGAFTRREALARGVSSSALDRRIQSGWVVRRRRGVLEVPALRDGLTDHALATLSVRGAALSHRSAAQRHRFALPVPRSIEVVTAFGGAGNSPFATVHRSRHLSEHDLVELDGPSSRRRPERCATWQARSATSGCCTSSRRSSSPPSPPPTSWSPASSHGPGVVSPARSPCAPCSTPSSTTSPTPSPPSSCWRCNA
ncbi:MAG: type IV toxin-antitoxin system AbiEi family antitoxin domain-containing protein [Acidimicrobiales bacterium]